MISVNQVKSSQGTNDLGPLGRQKPVARIESSGNPQELKQRAKELAGSEISFIGNDSFTERAACRRILGTPVDLGFNPEIISKGSASLPSHLARLCDAPLLENDQEQQFFRRMNYLLYRANVLRSRLSTRRPNLEKMGEVEDLLEQARAVKNRIVVANVRLVISIVKQLAPNPVMFDELLSDGLIAVIRAVEKFDYDRGYRFSTYATMVIRRQLYRCMKNDHRDRTRFTTGEPTIFSEHANRDQEPRIGYAGWVELNSSLTAMMEDLDERERQIIRARFGFDTDGKKQTLQALAHEFGVCKERVRQLEKRAMTKLKNLADSSKLEGLLDPEFATG